MSILSLCAFNLTENPAQQSESESPQRAETSTGWGFETLKKMEKSKETSEEVELVSNIQQWDPNAMWDPRPTDLTLVIGMWKFHVHKDVLEKSCHYFNRMFSSQMIEQTKDVISLQLVGQSSVTEHFKVLVECFYTGDLNVTPDTVFGVVQVADMLQVVPDIQSKYIDYMRENMINYENGLELMYFCASLNMKELYSDARRFCVAHFSEIRLTTFFVQLSVSELHDYLSDKYLVVEDEIHVVEAIHRWLQTNKAVVEPNAHKLEKLRTQIVKIVSSCVHVKDIAGAHSAITEEVFCNEPLRRHNFQHFLAKREQLEDIFFFWSNLLPTSTDKLNDVVKLHMDPGNAVKFDEMADIVKRPCIRMGTAFCTSGPYMYLSGGTPEFGKQNWIKQIWKFDVSLPFQRWSIVGELNAFRRSHAMVILENKLYTFGGFGQFRKKNYSLESLDLQTGNWEILSPMPVHEFDPAVTACNKNIFYISSNWTVYYFSLITQAWCELSQGDDPQELPFVPKPQALSVFKNGDTDHFAAVSFTETSIRISLFYIDDGAVNVCDNVPTYALTVPDLTYESSVTVNGKLVLFMTSLPSDTDGTPSTKKMIIFDPISLHFTDLSAVDSVKVIQYVVALPHLPTFEVRLVDFM